MAAAIVIPMLAGLGIAGLLLSGGKAKADTGGGGMPGGGGGGGAPPGAVNACEQAIAALPAELRGPVLKFWSESAGGGLTVAQLQGYATKARSLADVLSGAANIAPANQKASLQTAAQCLRDRAAELEKQAIAKSMGGGGGGGGGGAIPPVTPPVGTPPTSGFPGAVLIPSTSSPPKYGTPAGPAIVDHNGVPSSWDGGPAYNTIASNPYFTWKHIVKAGESPSAIVARVFGSDSLSRRAQLIDGNPTEFYTGRTLGSVGSPGSNLYNFASLLAGDVLLIPRDWNPWIDQTGLFRGSKGPNPWANPDGLYNPTPAPPLPKLTGGV
jgi:hypothetical protein